MILQIIFTVVGSALLGFAINGFIDHDTDQVIACGILAIGFLLLSISMTLLSIEGQHNARR